MRRALAILFAVALLGQANSGWAELFGGIDFPQGASSFADALIQYDPLLGGGPAPDPNQTGPPEAALGPPDHPIPGAPGTDNGDVALGRGGLIEVEFTDNVLTNSATADPDLHIFEIGDDVEDTFVAIRPADVETATAIGGACVDVLPPTSDGFCEIGKVFGSTSSIDIDVFFTGFAAGELRFDAVQLVDDFNEGNQTGTTVGADIDAVGAIASQAPVLDHYVSYKVRVPGTDVGGASNPTKLPKPWVITVDDVHLDDGDADDPENYEVKITKGLLVPAMKNDEERPSDPDLHYIRYLMKEGKQSVQEQLPNGRFPRVSRHVKRIWELQNQFGTVNVVTKKVSALLLPASKDLTGVATPLAGNETHFVCYQVKATKDVSDQTPDTGKGKERFRKDLQAFFEDQFSNDATTGPDCVDKEGNPNFESTGMEGKCLFDLKNPVEMCNPMNKSVVEGPRETEAESITESTTASVESLLCYKARLGSSFRSAAVAALAGAADGDRIKPRQSRHIKRRVKDGNPVYTAPANEFPVPTLLDTSKQDMVCVPTEVLAVSPKQ